MNQSNLTDIILQSFFPKMEYYCHIWSGAAQSSQSRDQNTLRHLVGNGVFHSAASFPKVTSPSLIYRYFYSKRSDEPRPLVPPVQILIVKIRHATSTELNRPYFFRIPNLRRKFYLNRLFPMICKLA